MARESIMTFILQVLSVFRVPLGSRSWALNAGMSPVSAELPIQGVDKLSLPLLVDMLSHKPSKPVALGSAENTEKSIPGPPSGGSESAQGKPLRCGHSQACGTRQADHFFH